MQISNIFSENLVAIDLEVPDKVSAISTLAELLYKNNYVKATYLDAVLEREKVFPTGLAVDPFGVALPHTDSVHVKQTGIAVGILSKSVQFQAMDAPDKAVEVKLIFLIAMKKSEMMVEILQKLAGVFQQPQILENLSTAAEPARVIQIINSIQSGEDE